MQIQCPAKNALVWNDPVSFCLFLLSCWNVTIVSRHPLCVDGVFFPLALHVACSTDETKLWLPPSGNHRRNPCSGPPHVYQDLCMRHDWSIKNPIVDLPIRLKGNTKRTSGFLLSPLGSENKDIGAASQTLLTEVKLRLRRRLPPCSFHTRRLKECVSGVKLATCKLAKH